MNWVFQQNGVINRHLPKKQLGNQPVRVLHNIVLYMFVHENDEFHGQLIEAVISKGMNPQVVIEYGDVPLIIEYGKYRTPSVGADKQLIIHETFLSYCWIMTYSMFVLFIETINHPNLNKEAGKIVKEIHPDEIQKAKDLFNYGKFLIVDYIEWDKSTLPNPEEYYAEKRDYPEQTNMYFTEALKFILCHEFIHITEHIDIFLEGELKDEEILQMELDADEKAIEIINKGMEPGREFIYECGIIVGILVLFFLSDTTKQHRHPDLEDRLINAFTKLNLGAHHPAWGFACIAFKLWEQQFDFQFVWDEPSNSDKDLFYKIVEQIKARKPST